MKVLQICDWAAVFAGAFNTVVMAVVCLMVWINRSQAAELGARLPPLLIMTAALAVFTATAIVAVRAVRRRSPWHWPAQAAMIGIAAVIAYLTQQLG